MVVQVTNHKASRLGSKAAPPIAFAQSVANAHLVELVPQAIELGQTGELARVLHGDNINEENLLQQLEESGHLPLFAALLSLLAEHLLLTEGFMPCAPAEGPTAQQLRTLLAKRQQL